MGRKAGSAEGWAGFGVELSANERGDNDGSLLDYVARVWPIVPNHHETRRQLCFESSLI